ncbi:type II secretion system F family protein [Herbiconiux sp. KACC 21604]|uniref:type II secretion system F family protein n=1 Tax=unclassified Herbiconiux TaxID=2618217 RepID=UPI001492AE5D|nr:type II secretion system F family protein [Herbiconiux sp. SALV-R1]QJU54535.1 hypothetical protein HL652_13460 [Herbiconiux sp. SALV-R1]WPO85618.1 type II secretion system F family protein [Herbiconiux sp. KACC 21604]
MCERLSALLEAGVAPRDAWLYLAELGDDAAVALVADRIRSGARVPEAIAAAGATTTGRTTSRSAPTLESRRRHWAALASVWFVAEASGAPFARTLSDMASSFTAIAAVERDTTVALAGPKATARLVLCLPLVAMAAGSVIGIDSARVLFTTPLGWLCLAAGSVLLLLAHLWSARLLRSARADGPAPGLGLDLLAIALTAGCPPPTAETLVEIAITRFNPLTPHTAPPRDATTHLAAHGDGARDGAAHDAAARGNGARDAVPPGDGARDAVPPGDGARDAVPPGDGARAAVARGDGARAAVARGDGRQGAAARHPEAHGDGARDAVARGLPTRRADARGAGVVSVDARDADWQIQARATMTLATRAGAHPATLLRREAARLRHESSTRAAARAASLAVWLMLPLGTCILPAFLFLSVVPSFLAILTTTVPQT